MDFELTSEHLMLKESAASFVKKDHSFKRLRELKDDEWGYSKEVWGKMAELGWMALIYPEQYDGLELEFSFSVGLLEEFGKGLLPEPWISTVLLAGNAVMMSGTEDQKQKILPQIASGDLMMTVAYLEDGGLYDVNFCSTNAEQKGDGHTLNGKKIFVLDGCSADKYIVSARTSGSVSDNDGITLFLIPRDAEGLKIIPLKRMDGGNACILELNDVAVGEGDIIGEKGGGYPVLADVIDQATAGLCIELVGGMNATLNMTVEYLTERMQFGKPIGTFQALQHKAADMFIQKELATSSAYYAIASMDEKTEDRAMAVSLAKAKCSAAFMDITKTAIQLFGAIGFTTEADIGFFLKRAKVTETLFGDVDYHLERYTALRDID